jgi:hypothetical protein
LNRRLIFAINLPPPRAVLQLYVVCSKFFGAFNVLRNDESDIAIGWNVFGRKCLEVSKWPVFCTEKFVALLQGRIDKLKLERVYRIIWRFFR